MSLSRPAPGRYVSTQSFLTNWAKYVRGQDFEYTDLPRRDIWSTSMNQVMGELVPLMQKYRGREEFSRQDVEELLEPITRVVTPETVQAAISQLLREDAEADCTVLGVELHPITDSEYGHEPMIGPLNSSLRVTGHADGSGASESILISNLIPSKEFCPVITEDATLSVLSLGDINSLLRSAAKRSQHLSAFDFSHTADKTYGSIKERTADCVHLAEFVAVLYLDSVYDATVWPALHGSALAKDFY